MRKNRHLPSKRKSFAFVVDGPTETWYLQMLRRNEPSLSVSVEPKIPQNKNIKDQYELVNQLANDYDHVFWIVDLDDVKEKTLAAPKGKETPMQQFEKYHKDLSSEKAKERITIIVNNPCIEFWFLLHFESTAKYFDNCKKCEDQLKKHLKGYEKTRKFYTKQNQDIYLKLKPNLRTAIKNAKKLKAMDFEHPNSGLSQMQFLFEKLFPES